MEEELSKAIDSFLSELSLSYHINLKKQSLLIAFIWLNLKTSYKDLRQF